MFGIGFTELVLILIIALIVLGPEKLPGIATALGKAYAEFKKAGEELKKNIAEPEHGTEEEDEEEAHLPEKPAAKPPEPALKEEGKKEEKGKRAD